MKKVLYTLIFLFPFLGYSQQKANLDRQIGLDATLLGIGVFYEQPIFNNILGDISLGYGSNIFKGDGAVSSDFKHYNPYSRIAVKFYYNRNKRIQRGKSILRNWGNFIGIQNKIMYNIKEDENYLPYMINEVHWGVQTELDNRLLLTFTLGMGYYSTNYENTTSFYPTSGVRLKYVLF